MATKTISFGTYPQNLVTDGAIVSALGGYDSTWHAFPYVCGTVEEKKVPLFEDYMYYTDKTLNGKQYRGVYFTSYRADVPFLPGWKPNSRQYYNGYPQDTVFWFEYAPIVWDVVGKTQGGNVLVSQKVLDSQEFFFYADSNAKTRKDYQGNCGNVMDCNYQFSSIRGWLNTHFFNTAFGKTEQRKILQTTQDNSPQSTKVPTNPYCCANTSDKVFLLSVEEVEQYFPEAPQRLKFATDYAKCQNAWIFKTGHCALWWLRSPYQLYGSSAKQIFYNGKVESGGAFSSNVGVVPAIVVE